MATVVLGLLGWCLLALLSAVGWAALFTGARRGAQRPQYDVPAPTSPVAVPRPRSGQTQQAARV